LSRLLGENLDTVTKRSTMETGRQRGLGPATLIGIQTHTPVTASHIHITVTIKIVHDAYPRVPFILLKLSLF
jgi:hypothetical protein